MTDGKMRISLEEVEAAAQAVRFELLGRAGWFRATEAADDLGVERGTVREHARVLTAHRLLRRREVARAPKDTYEWHVTARGVEVRRRLMKLLRQPYRPRRNDPPRIAALLALQAAEGMSLSEALLEAAHERVEAVAGYLVGAKD